MGLFRRSSKPPAPPPADAPPPRCAFCKLERAQVKFLVAGPDGVCICDDCVRLSMNVLAEHGLDAKDPIALLRVRIEGALGAAEQPIPHATSGPLLAAWLALTDGSAKSCRVAVAMASRARNPHAALAALARIPADAREPSDPLNEAAYHEECGAYERALAILERLDPSTWAPVDGILLACHRALCAVRAGKVDEAGVPAVLEVLADARRSLDALGDDAVSTTLRAAIEREIRHARAWCALNVGDTRTAALLARESSAKNEDDPEAHALLARALAREGDRAGSEAARDAALRFAHPDGHLAQTLRVPVAGPYR